MKKKLIRIVIVLLVLGAIGAGVWYFFFREQEQQDNMLVLYGNVDIRQVELAFNASDRIAAIRVEEGDAVEKGEVLATLETVRLQHNVDQAEAQVEAQREVVARLEAGSRKEEINRAEADVAAAKVTAENAEQTYRRLEPLARQNLTSEEQLDEARAKAEGARARLLSARAALDLALAGPRQEEIASARATRRAQEAALALARQKLEDATLRAPDDGIIRNRILQPGDMAFPQRPVLTLALINPVWVRTFVPESDLGRIFSGMSARIITDSFPDKVYEGWVGYISPTAEFTPKTVQTPEIRTSLVYQMRVFVCNPRNELRLGMPVTVKIPLDQSRTGTERPPCQETNGTGG